mmetsp:Transcript_57180/g.164228  ORF Transcript_57180/g.164228 Transcript_57180/m.164228 type:complete len:274 (+) Transcript_57180:624-1445(+)
MFRSGRGAYHELPRQAADHKSDTGASTLGPHGERGLALPRNDEGGRAGHRRERLPPGPHRLQRRHPLRQGHLPRRERHQVRRVRRRAQRTGRGGADGSRVRGPSAATRPHSGARARVLHLAVPQHPGQDALHGRGEAGRGRSAEALLEGRVRLGARRQAKAPRDLPGADRLQRRPRVPRVRHSVRARVLPRALRGDLFTDVQAQAKGEVQRADPRGERCADFNVERLRHAKPRQNQQVAVARLADRDRAAATERSRRLGPNFHGVGFEKGWLD